MLTYRPNIVHCPQLGHSNCGPVALQCMFDAPVSEIERIVKCKRGTNTLDLLAGMKEHGIECSRVILDDDHSNHLWWLEACSYRWPIYLSCAFVSQGTRGRPSTDHHAVLFANGMCYDGNEPREEPIASIVTKFNKRFVIKEAVIFVHELGGWQKNVETFQDSTCIL